MNIAFNITFVQFRHLHIIQSYKRIVLVMKQNDIWKLNEVNEAKSSYLNDICFHFGWGGGYPCALLSLRGWHPCCCPLWIAHHPHLHAKQHSAMRERNEKSYLKTKRKNVKMYIWTSYTKNLLLLLLVACCAVWKKKVENCGRRTWGNFAAI